MEIGVKRNMTSVEMNHRLPAFDAYTQKIEIYGQPFSVRKSISRTEKEDAASEMIAMGTIFNEELGVCYDALNRDVTNAFVIVKYYTNLDVSEYDTQEGRYTLYDMLIDSGAYSKIIDAIQEDYQELLSVYEHMKEIYRTTFERKHSLAYMIQQAMGGLMTGSDQNDVVTGAREVNAELIEALGALAKTRAEKKPDANLLLFAKRENLQ